VENLYVQLYLEVDQW